MEEYDEDKTIFDFENDDTILSVWIDKYVDDPCYAEDGHVPEDPGLRLNGLACGRNIAAKDGSGSSWMFAHEIIMTHDVVALRDGVRAFAKGEINSFGPYPKKDPYGGDRPFFSLWLHRNENGNVSFSALTDAPGIGIDEVEGMMSAARLDELCAYFARIAEWFPPRVEEGPAQESLG